MLRRFFNHKDKRLLKLSVLLSRVFDPILLLPLLLLAAGLQVLQIENGWMYLGILFLINVVLPGFVFVYFVKRGTVSTGWDIRDRTERVPLFFFIVVAHLVGVLGAFLLGAHPLAEYLATFWVLTVVFALVTTKWKISVHCGVLSTLVTFLILTYGGVFVWLYGFLLLVVWARVYGRYHRLAQALAGAVVPIVLMPVMFSVFGLI